MTSACTEAAHLNSPASAPLLDMLKDRKGGDAVRSAIERITGAGKRPAPAESPTAENAKETPKDNAKSN